MFDLVGLALLFDQAWTATGFHEAFLMSVVGGLAAVLAKHSSIAAPWISADRVTIGGIDRLVAGFADHRHTLIRSARITPLPV